MIERAPFRVRKAGLSDLELITKLAQGQSIDKDLEACMELGWVRVAENSSPEPLGYVIFRPEERQKHTELLSLGVAEPHRRAGLGSRLLQQAWMFCPHHEMRVAVPQDTELALRCLEAISFFKHYGFTVYGKQDGKLLFRANRDDWWGVWNQSDRA